MTHMKHILGQNAKCLKALDVACGTGVFTRALSSAYDEVVGLDATQEMLSEARGNTDEDTTNISYILGDCAILPFVDDSFDLITSRLAVHHFDRPFDKVKEMARVCKVGGAVFIVDIVSNDNPEILGLHNKLENLRDPSHTEMLASKSLSQLLSKAGLEVFPSILRFDNVLYVDEWLKSTRTPEKTCAEIVSALQREIKEGVPSLECYHLRTRTGVCALSTSTRS